MTDAARPPSAGRSHSAAAIVTWLAAVGPVVLVAFTLPEGLAVLSDPNAGMGALTGLLYVATAIVALITAGLTVTAAIFAARRPRNAIVWAILGAVIQIGVTIIWLPADLSAMSDVESSRHEIAIFSLISFLLSATLAVSAVILILRAMKSTAARPVPSTRESA